MEPKEYLRKFYENTMVLLGSNDKIKSNLDARVKGYLNEVLENSESAKAVLAVTFTSIVYKHLNPEQDIRNHQVSIPNGYSGRTFDAKNITPLLQEFNFPFMKSGSGWLTRSLEQKVPYDANYSGAINPSTLKHSFLNLIEVINDGEDLEEILSYLLQGLIIKRNKQKINLAKPVDLPISVIIRLLKEHSDSPYKSEGASRLPVLALYAVYQCLINEAKRFEGKELLSIESHTSADSRSGRIGDVDIVDENGREFEAVEVKFGIPITAQLIRGSFEKFKTTQVKRYYLLSTANIDENDKANIEKEIERIKNIHGCNVIANGLIHTLNYYLRLVSDTSVFISNYVDLVEEDGALKFEHKQQWNVINSIR